MPKWSDNVFSFLFPTPLNLATGCFGVVLFLFLLPNCVCAFFHYMLILWRLIRLSFPFHSKHFSACHFHFNFLLFFICSFCCYCLLLFVRSFVHSCEFQWLLWRQQHFLNLCVLSDVCNSLFFLLSLFSSNLAAFSALIFNVHLSTTFLLFFATFVLFYSYILFLIC